VTGLFVAVIVTYNRKALLLRCLQAVSEQTLKPNRIVIVDNASTDGTVELLRTAGWLDHADIELLALDHNIGGAGGFSVGMQRALDSGAHWLWTMDDDGYPESDCLELLANGAASRQISAIAPIHYDIEAPSRTAFRTLDNRGREIHALPYEPDNGDPFIPNEANLFNGFLVRSDVLRAAGLPRGELFIRGDEVEYVRRLRQKKIPFGTLATAKFYHPSDRQERIFFLGKIGRARDAKNAFKNYYMYRNKAVAFRENKQIWLIPFDFARYFFYFLIFKRWDWAGFQLWLKASKDGLLGRLGRHPDF